MATKNAGKITGDKGNGRNGSDTKRYGDLRGRQGVQSALWSLVDSGVLRRCVGAVTGAGDAITFALTRDGGAACIAVLSDGEVIKLYGSSSEELEEFLAAIADGAQQAIMSSMS